MSPKSGKVSQFRSLQGPSFVLLLMLAMVHVGSGLLDKDLNSQKPQIWNMASVVHD